MPQIHGKEHPIRQIFSVEYAFTIPPYQRPYSWGREQVVELWDDLRSASQLGKGGKAEPYFLGSIVLIKNESAPEAEVIDGQQRLTTVALLLAVLIKILPTEVSDGMKASLYEKGNKVMGTQDRFRLRLRERDNVFFEDHVLKSKDLLGVRALDPEKLPDPQKRLRENLIYFADELDKLTVEDRQEIATYLIQQVFLIVVWTPNLESAFRIFSVLNDRGLDLSAADILKAEIIGAIPGQEQPSYTKKWEEAEQALGTEAFSMLFSHIRFIHARKKQRGTILSEFREFVQTKSNPKKFVDEQLVPYARAFEDITKRSYESTAHADEVNHLLLLLSRMDESDWVAPAILFHAKNQNKAELLRQFYTDLERLAAAIWIMRHDVNQRIERYGLLLNAVAKGENLFEKESPLQLTTVEMIQTAAILNGDIYNISRKTKRTMILLRLDEVLSSGEASYHFEVITIEHVLPQNPAPDSEWMKWWPDEVERGRSVHRLGNLLLLNKRQNSSANNYEFGKKKTSYFASKIGTSPFSLTTQVLREQEWTPSVFNRRQDALLNALKKAWRLETP